MYHPSGSYVVARHGKPGEQKQAPRQQDPLRVVQQISMTADETDHQEAAILIKGSLRRCVDAAACRLPLGVGCQAIPTRNTSLRLLAASRRGSTELATVVVAEFSKRHPVLKKKVMGEDPLSWLRGRPEFSLQRVGAGQFMLSEAYVALVHGTWPCIDRCTRPMPRQTINNG